MRFADVQNIPLQIFRLAGIYGPGRNPIDRVRNGTARRIIKPGQVFNRIHVADIVGILQAGLTTPSAIGVFNVTDSYPAPPQDVITYAAQYAGVPPPPAIAFEHAELSPMARSFYANNKRVRSHRVPSELAYNLRYPTYREGIDALAKQTDGH